MSQDEDNDDFQKNNSPWTQDEEDAINDSDWDND